MQKIYVAQFGLDRYDSEESSGGTIEFAALDTAQMHDDAHGDNVEAELNGVVTYEMGLGPEIKEQYDDLIKALNAGEMYVFDDGEMVTVFADADKVTEADVAKKARTKYLEALYGELGD